MSEEQLYILVVEDNPRNQRLVDMVLRRHYRLSLAEDGEQALAAVERELPDLILLDIQIPKIDGLEVARRLKGDPKTREIPIIAPDLVCHAHGSRTDPGRGLRRLSRQTDRHPDLGRRFGELSRGRWDSVAKDGRFYG